MSWRHGACECCSGTELCADCTIATTINVSVDAWSCDHPSIDSGVDMALADGQCISPRSDCLTVSTCNGAQFIGKDEWFWGDSSPASGGLLCDACGFGSSIMWPRVRVRTVYGANDCSGGLLGYDFHVDIFELGSTIKDTGCQRLVNTIDPCNPPDVTMAFGGTCGAYTWSATLTFSVP